MLQRTVSAGFIAPCLPTSDITTDIARELRFRGAGGRVWRLDCMAGHVRFELRNVVANYPFEKSRRFAGNQPNSGHGEHSRLSCGAVIRSSGPAASIPRPRAHVGPKMIRQRQSQQHHCSVCAGLSAQRERVWVITDAEPDRLVPLTLPAPMGLRGVCVVAARCFAPALRRAVAPTLLRGVLHVQAQTCAPP